MRLNFKTKLLSGVLALFLFVTACGSGNTDGTEAGSFIEESQDVSVEDEDKDVVGIAPDEDIEEIPETDTSADTEEVELTEEEKEWQNYLIADVFNTLRIRQEPTTESEMIGVLETGARALVLEKGAEWTKISSGEVEGYVSNEFCLYGTDALNYTKEHCEKVATSTMPLLNIRKEMSTESVVLGQIAKDDSLPVALDATTGEGWVAVTYYGATAYVSADCVKVDFDVKDELTVTELYAQEIAQSQTNSSWWGSNSSWGGSDTTTGTNTGVTPTQTTINTECIVNASEYEVLAAMIWCESGNQSYECNLAVASVIMNRVRGGIFANTVKEVVFQPGQFPPATNGPLENCLKYGKTTENCYKAAQAAMNGEDNTDGCLYFNTYNGTREGLRIGAMVFWKSW